MRHLITAGCIVAALAAYYFGLSSGSGLLLIAAAVLEIVSAKRLSRRPQSAALKPAGFDDTAPS